MASSQSNYAESWVSQVIGFSSQYDAQRWCANTVVGQPSVYPQYGDIVGAWAQGTRDANQFIELEFDKTLYIEEVRIYETYNSGAVKRVSCRDLSGQWVVIWEIPGPSRITQSRIFSPPINKPNFPSNQLRLDVDCSASHDWCEIDAVQIRGRLKLIESPPPLEDLSNDLKMLINSQLFSDVCFEIEGQKVYAHKAILCARSEYFRAMFAGGLKESKNQSASNNVVIPDVTYSAFLGLLQYIYTNFLETEYDVSPLSLVEMIRVGDRFSLDGLKKFAHCHLADKIDVENVVDIYIDAVTKLPALDKVKQTCLEFISLNMKEVTKSKAFSNLPQEHMLEIVQEATAKLKI